MTRLYRDYKPDIVHSYRTCRGTIIDLVACCSLGSPCKHFEAYGRKYGEYFGAFMTVSEFEEQFIFRGVYIERLKN